jgi:oxygen-independent coproporphyrinogen-3 oxidase
MQRKRWAAGSPHHAGMTEAIARTRPRTAAREALLRRMQGQGPRYAAYPTADRFGPTVDATGVERALAARREQSAAGIRTPLAVHLRVPPDVFEVERSGGLHAAEYVDALELEIALVTDQVGACRAVSDLHLGGGAPTFLPDAGLDRLMGAIRRSFFLTHDAGLSIDVDPRHVDPGRVRHLRSLGFDRIRLAVHGLDPGVHRAPPREESFERLQALTLAARDAGIASIDLELVYGLPGQTPSGLQRVLAQAAGLKPDRIRVRGYSNRPARPAARGGDAAAELPDDPQRCAMLAGVLDALESQGYRYVGGDRFALAPAAPDLPAHITQLDGDRIGLGIAAIGRVGDCAYQNDDTLDEYYAALEANRLPVARGLVLDADDRARRDIIAALMSCGRVDFDEIRGRHGMDVREAFSNELVRLAPLAADGLVELRGDGIRVTRSGRYAARAIAMVFDRYLRRDARHDRGCVAR